MTEQPARLAYEADQVAKFMSDRNNERSRLIALHGGADAIDANTGRAIDALAEVHAIKQCQARAVVDHRPQWAAAMGPTTPSTGEVREAYALWMNTSDGESEPLHMAEGEAMFDRWLESIRREHRDELNWLRSVVAKVAKAAAQEPGRSV